MVAPPVDAPPPTPPAAVAPAPAASAAAAPAGSARAQEAAAPRRPESFAPTEYRPTSAREEELCETASSTDYLYWAGSFAVAMGAFYADAHWVKFIGNDPDNAGKLNGPAPSAYGPGARLPGPAIAGLTWGFFVGGGYLAQPKCSPGWVRGPAIEGDYRSTWHLPVALALLAGVTAPVIDYYFIGGVPQQWPVYERSLRVILGGVGGFAGAFLPYLLPPKTWAAAKELQHLRATVDGTSATLGYTFTF